MTHSTPWLGGLVLLVLACSPGTGEGPSDVPGSDAMPAACSVLPRCSEQPSGSVCPDPRCCRQDSSGQWVVASYTIQCLDVAPGDRDERDVATPPPDAGGTDEGGPDVRPDAGAGDTSTPPQTPCEAAGIECPDVFPACCVIQGVLQCCQCDTDADCAYCSGCSCTASKTCMSLDGSACCGG